MTIKVLNAIFAILVFFQLSCEQKKTTLGKVELILEIDLTDPDKPEMTSDEDNAKKLTKKQLEKERSRNLTKVNLIISPLARYFGNSIYVRSNGRIKKIIKVNISGKEALVLATEKLEPKIVRLTNRITNNTSEKGDLVPTKFKQFPFDNILDMAPCKNEAVYVMNFYDPSEKIVYKSNPPDDKKKKKARKEKKEQKAKKTNISDLVKYIYKFNNQGEFLYKIGKEGKINTDSTTGKPFVGNQQINKMICDQHGNLCLILQSFNPKAKASNLYGHHQYEFYRFSPKGKRDMYIHDLSKLLSIDKDYNSQIERIEITPVSEKLLFQVAYYLKKKSPVSQKIAYKKLILVSLRNPSNSKVVKKLEGTEISYTIFEVTENDNIYLHIPPPKGFTSYNTKKLKNEFTFQVINKNGNNVVQKEITLTRRPDDEMHWFTLGEKGQIIIFIKTKTKLIVIFKKE
ncbi:MAG: hypothetical protein IEMM0008_1576 [bacterium]|nr:MAG: hypothetical protein IEMM0008_1576 [bacterium]